MNAAVIQTWVGRFTAADTVSGRLLRHLPVAVVVAASTVLIALSVTKIVRQTLTPVPIDMWEAATISVATRVAHGEPMYRLMNTPEGIEPGLYSPLQPLVLSLIFRWTGPNFAAARAINLAAGALFIVIFLRALDLRRHGSLLLFGTAVLLMLDRQLTGLWDLPRADAVPLLCGLVFVCCAFNACGQDRFWWVIGAHTALLVGLMWKQTIVAIAPAAFLASLLTPGCARRMRLIFLFGPIGVIAVTLIIAYLASPNLFETMFRLGGRFAIQGRVLALFAYAFLLFTPLLWMMLWFVLFRSPTLTLDAKFRWAVATAVVSVPLDFMAAAKVGGGPNSLAHVLYALGGAALCCAPEWRAWLRSEQLGIAKRLVFSGALATALIVEWTTVFHAPSRVHLNRPFGDSGRTQVIAFARTLRGKVVSPQDPMIALQARGYAGVAVANEWDRRLWQWPLPKVQRELEQADYVITWGRTNTWQSWTFDKGFDELSKLGFERIEVPGLHDSEYAVWGRTRTQ